MNVFMFSGQGSQYAGMGKELYDSFPSARNIFEEANRILGYSISDVMFHNEEELNDTSNTQVAMFTLYAAILEVLKEHQIEAEYTCGLSLGEYGAMYYSGMFDFETGIKLLQKRGQFMMEASKVVDGKMSAIIGLDAKDLLDICEQVDGYVTIANYNTYGQLVISGSEEAVHQANELALEKGAKRAILLNTSGPFHSKLMDEARQKFEAYIQDLSFNEPNKTLLINTTGDYYQSNIKEVMAQQITSSVKFYQMIERCMEDGVTNFIEIGPKTVLSGFVKKVNRKLGIMNVEDMASLEKTMSKLEVE